MRKIVAEYRTTLERLLRNNGIALWRLELLLKAAAITYTTNDVLRRAQRADERIAEGETVLVDDKSALYARLLDNLPPDAFRDYVFAPFETMKPEEGKFVALGWEVLRRREGINRIEGPTSIRGFIRALADGAAAAGPIRNLYIVTHSAPGYLFSRLDDISPKDHITHRDLVRVAAADGKGPLALAPEVLAPRPTNSERKAIPATLYVRGCRFGKAAPMVDALKAALGGAIRVSGPRFMMSYQPRRSPAGLLEHFAYAFELFEKDKADSRDALIATFKRHKEFVYFDGETNIEPGRWDKWLPGNIHPHPKDAERRTTRALVAELKLTDLPVTYEYAYTSVWGVKQQLSLPGGKDPGTDEGRIKAVHAWIRATQPAFLDEAVPAYAEYGFKSLVDFLSGVHWHFDPVRLDGILRFNAWYHYYALFPPVVELRTDKLKFYNFFPEPPKNGSRRVATKPKAFMKIDENDPAFFLVR